ncbi:MAG TPA: tetratricopeptide repeat protein, partial [Gammaproteobacteria bacterium]|nr:tetratricopeptide repeat protein [Gammaproteobacteria bacterium]
MSIDDQIQYRFGRCVVDPRLRQIHVDGILADAQPKAFDLLLYLINNRNRVIDKDELLHELWPGVIVSESALTQALRKARAMVGDDGSRQEVIKTVQRRGFRFVAEIQATPDSARSGMTTAQPIADASAAVLPFADMSPNRDQEYFCDGMTEEIITALTRTPGLKVPARTSVFALKGSAMDVREIGRMLGVATVLEGSVRKSGERLRVTAQLIDAGSGFHVWSERWDRGLEDMLTIQDEIAERIAEAIKPGARPPESLPEPSAEEFCRRGLAYVHRFSRRSQRFAQELFRQALALDPANARAWSGLAISEVLVYRYSAATEERRDDAVRAANRAVELDPDSPDAWTAKGAAATICCEFEDAAKAFSRAIELDPEHFEAHYYFGRACTESGQLETAAELYERAATLRPMDYQALLFALQTFRFLGLSDKAKEMQARVVIAAEHAIRDDPTDARALSLTACSLKGVGRDADAREWLNRAIALEPDEPHVLYNCACGFLHLGETETALALLERIDFSVMTNKRWMD